MAKVVSRAVQGKASKGHIVLINCQSSSLGLCPASDRGLWMLKDYAVTSSTLETKPYEDMICIRNHCFHADQKEVQYAHSTRADDGLSANRLGDGAARNAT